MEIRIEVKTSAAMAALTQFVPLSANGALLLFQAPTQPLVLQIEKIHRCAWIYCVELHVLPELAKCPTHTHLQFLVSTIPHLVFR